MEDGRLSYLIGYYPAKRDPGSGFRSIALRTGSPGLVVRHRRGYFASAPRVDPKSRDQALREALQQPLAATQVGLSAAARYDEQTSTVTIDVTLDPHSLSADLTASRMVDLLVADVSRNGMATVRETRTMDVTPGPTSANFRIPVASDFHQLRVVAREAASGRVGSLVIPASSLRY